MDTVDVKLLNQTIQLASKGLGAVSPNPAVGAVIADGEEILATGYHQRYGDLHAEVEALNKVAGRDLSRATMYVSLEPCCHYGRTPPCVDAVKASGIRRVVIASLDPSEKVNGKGVDSLSADGVEVVLADGTVRDRAELINQPFRKYSLTGKPLVIYKSAQTIDGKTATSSGQSQWISSEDSRKKAHQLRAECDAVVAGIGTVVADDALLTARSVVTDKQPLRVVFDSQCRLSAKSRLVQSVNEGPVLVFCSGQADTTQVQSLQSAGVQVLRVGNGNKVDVTEALELLGKEGVTSLLLEGGPTLAEAFLSSGNIDRIELFIAPLLIGGSSAPSLFAGDGVKDLSEALSTDQVEYSQVGRDLHAKLLIRRW